MARWFEVFCADCQRKAVEMQAIAQPVAAAVVQVDVRLVSIPAQTTPTADGGVRFLAYGSGVEIEIELSAADWERLLCTAPLDKDRGVVISGRPSLRPPRGFALVGVEMQVPDRKPPT